MFLDKGFVEEVYKPKGATKLSHWETDEIDEHLTPLEELPDDIDRIGQSFAGRSLFITGGTGFMGKVLVEKLLRCTEVKKIYLLIRTKKGKDPAVRIKEIFQNELFDLVKSQRGEDVINSMLHAIPGDVMLPNMGISDADRQLIAKEVSVIYHCAATIRFDECLRVAVLMNTRGTKYAIELAKMCKKLDLFAYISTSYCHLHEKHLLEIPYDPPADPNKVIKTCEWLTDEDIDKITPHILQDYPNSYAYTKSLAENLVVQSFDDIKSIILRPSIVVPIWKEPIPGWTDNINGPTGLLIGAGKGVIRTMYCNSSGYGDFLPVDVAVNGMLIASWYNLKDNNVKMRVGHMTSSNEIKVSWSELIELGRWVIENRVPLNGVAWYPGGSMKSNYYIHYLCVLFFHWLPAIFVDCLLFIFRYPPVLCRVQRRVMKGFEVFEYYANNVWCFDNTQAIEVRRHMNKTERKKYIIERIDLDLISYFEACVLCARRYILHETDDTIPAAKRHMRVMWFVDKICKGLFYFWILYMIYTRLLSGFFEDGADVGKGSILKQIENTM